MLSFDESFWYQVEEDPVYVTRTLDEWEEILLGAIPNISEKLEIGDGEIK